MKSPFLERLARGPLLGDGAMGTLLYARGVSFDQNFDELNLSQPALVGQVHRDYLSAGAELIETNTFGANRVRLAPYGIEDKVRVIARQGARVARDAREVMGIPAFVGGSIGPLGKPLAPFGAIAREDAVAAFREAAEGLLEGGVDLFLLETFADLAEIEAALAAVRALSDLPVVALLTYGDDGRTFYGHTPADAYHALADQGADVIGANCSVGPQGTLDVVQAYAAARAARGAGAPWIAAMPNAGLPHLVNGRYAYMATPEYFASYTARFLAAGARIVGGCCGTTPAHVLAMRQGMAPPARATRDPAVAPIVVNEPAPPAPIAAPFEAPGAGADGAARERP